jgi:DNA polymerase III delta prime subunit
LWLEGADDLTPEAQAFLRRILETHAQDVLFILECRDAGRLQEPIRSRCVIKKMSQPTWMDMEHYLKGTFNGLNTNEIKEYLKKNEYSYRRAKQCAFLQLQYPEIWENTINHRRKESSIITSQIADDLLVYIKEGYNPENLINKLLSDEKILKDYGKCAELSGSLWAFLGSALFRASRTTENE